MVVQDVTKSFILCVDDDKTILLSLRAQLRHSFGTRFGYEVAESAHEAWEVIDELHQRGETLALIISDWLMPKTKGDEFLIEVHERHPDIVKMMLTGQADPEAIERAQQHANLAHCFTKPWIRDELVRVIEAALNQHD